MNTKKILLFASLILFTSLTGITLASSQDRYVRLRYVTGDVTVYPSDNDRSTQATTNTPVLDRDEITTNNGRAELAFRDGIAVRLGDYSDIRLTSSDSPVSIELLNGTIFVDSSMVNALRDELEVTSGDAQIYMINEGMLRIDHGSQGSVRVTSISGEAEVRAAGRRVLLEAGERTYVDQGATPEQPELFSGSYDDLDNWNESRSRLYAGRYDDNRYVDESIQYDTNDLYGYGDWRSYDSYGYVWVPRVNYGWRPYSDGYWSHCNSGWFWISYEPWGWAPYHYGRWGWTSAFGWYWIPGSVFAPSWVSWYNYGNYLGWCPLNYWNQPVIVNNYYFNHHLPTVQKQKTLDVGNAWTFIKKDQIGTSNIRKVTLGVDEIKKIQIDQKSIRPEPGVDYVLPKGRNDGLPDGTVVRKDTEDGLSNVKHNQEIKQKQQDWEQDHNRTKTTTVNPPDIKDRQTGKDNGRDNQFGHGKTGNGNEGNPTPVFKTPPKNDGSSTDRKTYLEPPVEHKSKTDSWKDYGSTDRDDQFRRDNSDRNDSDKQRDWNSYFHSLPPQSDQNSNEDAPVYRDPKSDYRDSGDNNNRNQDEITPRYSDDVKKMFERHDWKKSGDSNNNGGSDRKLNWKNPPSPSPKYNPPPQRRENSGNRSTPPPPPPPKKH